MKRKGNMKAPLKSKDLDGPIPEDLTAALSPELAADIMDQAIARYAQSRRALVPDFVKKTYGWKGAAGLHRQALGWDLMRAPANLILGGATGLARLGGLTARAVGARRVGNRLSRFHAMIETDVGREVVWRLHADLLAIPYRQPGRACMADALFEEILADPRLASRLDQAVQAIAQEADKRVFEKRLNATLTEYIGARSPATDITAAFMSAAVGYAAYQKATPGLITLSSTVAASLAQSIAISSFWAGPWAGGLYYALAGAPAASTALTAGVFAGLTVPAAAFIALAGMVSDPIQASSGLHQRRLIRLIDTLENNLKSQQDTPLPLRSHYIARVVDLWEWTAIAYRLTSKGVPV